MGFRLLVKRLFQILKNHALRIAQPPPRLQQEKEEEEIQKVVEGGQLIYDFMKKEENVQNSIEHFFINLDEYLEKSENLDVLDNFLQKLKEYEIGIDVGEEMMDSENNEEMKSEEINEEDRASTKELVVEALDSLLHYMKLNEGIEDEIEVFNPEGLKRTGRADDDGS